MADVSVTIAGMLMLQLIFLMLGAWVGAGYKKSGKANAVSAAVLFLTFLLSVAIDLNDKFTSLKYFSPFKYFEAKQMINGEGLETVYVVLSIVLIAVFLFLTFVFYKKRDLRV